MIWWRTPGSSGPQCSTLTTSLPRPRPGGRGAVPLNILAPPRPPSQGHRVISERGGNYKDFTPAHLFLDNISSAVKMQPRASQRMNPNTWSDWMLTKYLPEFSSLSITVSLITKLLGPVSCSSALLTPLPALLGSRAGPGLVFALVGTF